MISRDSDGIISIKYANSGDVGLGGLDLNELWPIIYSTPGGSFPQRIQFNQLFLNLSALGKEINQNGPFLGYSASIDYGIGAVVPGSDDILYYADIANGPASSAVDPVGDLTGTWVTFESKLLDSSLFRGHLSGINISLGADALHDFTLGEGSASLYNGSVYKIFSSSANKTKQIDSTFAEGDNVGGFPDTLTLTVDTLYYIIELGKPDGTLDVSVDTVKAGTNALADAVAAAAGYTFVNVRGSFRTKVAALEIDPLTIGDARPESDFRGAEFMVVDQKAQNTHGGTFTLGAWRTRDLNTTRINEIPGAIVSSNQISLPAGDYIIRWSCPAQFVSGHVSGLYNVTDAAFEAYGSAGKEGNNNTINHSIGVTEIKITAAKVFEIQHQCITTAATTGFGAAVNLAPEVYTQVEIKAIRLL